MKTKKRIEETTVWRSEKRPDVTTADPRLADAIAWADAQPHAWNIVTQTRSKALGVGSSEYIGWAQRGLAPDAILERVSHLRMMVHGRDRHLSPDHLFCWRARFTLDHYGDAGFAGGCFTQYDRDYPRLCTMLDYTPETLEEVIGRFLGWCARDYRTTHVDLDGDTVRTLEGS